MGGVFAVSTVLPEKIQRLAADLEAHVRDRLVEQAIPCATPRDTLFMEELFDAIFQLSDDVVVEGLTVLWLLPTNKDDGRAEYGTDTRRLTRRHLRPHRP